MKLSTFITLGLSGLALAAPTPTTPEKRGNLVKRASVTETPTTGYATQNGGTKGGKGGSTTTVSTYAQFTAAVTDDTARIVIVSGTITKAARVKVGSNKSIIGKNSSAKLVGIGLYINSKKNVIIRNLGISKVLAANGDAIGIQASKNVWVDHCDLSSDTSHDKDYYDGLLDVTHASDYVTISNTFLHDHWKASLVGHSDSNGGEDTGHLRVTYANNYWYNVHSRGPSVRFGTVHIFNNYYLSVKDGINTRNGAQVLVESNDFDDCANPLYSTDKGYAVASDNDFGSGSNEALKGTISSVPYSYTKLGSAKVKAAVYGTAGNTLSF
jgi:pectate lyase